MVTSPSLRSAARHRVLRPTLLWVIVVVASLLTTTAPAPTRASTPLACAPGSFNGESRGWWTPAGQSIDLYRGVDVEACVPTGPVSGSLALTLHVQLRHNPSTITTLRVQVAGDFGQKVAYQKSVSLKGDAAGDGEWFIPAVLDTTVSPADGYQELRFTANIAHDEFGKRQYQSTGFEVNLNNGGGRPTSTYRSLPWIEARGWYVDTGYTNVRFRSVLPTGPVAGRWTFTFGAVAGSGGTPVTYHAVYVDANTHNIPMILPHVYAAGAGAYTGSVTIDTTQLANGSHKLLLRADSTVATGTNSGVLQLLFSVKN